MFDQRSNVSPNYEINAMNKTLKKKHRVIAGCIPVKQMSTAKTHDDDESRIRTKEDELQILLVTSSKQKNTWVLPKGAIKKGETAEDAAMRETKEEAGVQGKIQCKIDTSDLNVKSCSKNNDYHLVNVIIVVDVVV